MAATYNPKRPRSFITVPSGMGKSRIIAAIVVLQNEFGGADKFTIVFPNKLLKSVDEVKYQRLAHLMGATIDLVVASKETVLAGAVNRESIVLVDEADRVLLDYYQTLPNKQVIGLSATACT